MDAFPMFVLFKVSLFGLQERSKEIISPVQETE